MSDQPVIRIDYDEFYPETYRAVVLEMPGRPPVALADGSGPVPDLRAAIDVARTTGKEIMFMSSVDHFISDLPQASEQREDLRALRDGDDPIWHGAEVVGDD